MKIRTWRYKCVTYEKTNNNWIYWKANLVHNNKYDYSKTKYVKSREKVCIICPVHGEFWQLANGHLSGQGCPECGKDKQTNSKRTSWDKLLLQFKEIHGNMYYYEQRQFKTQHDNINIFL